MKIPENWALIPLTEIADINPPKPPKDAFPQDTLFSFIPMAAIDAIKGEISEYETRPFKKVLKGSEPFDEANYYKSSQVELGGDDVLEEDDDDEDEEVEDHEFYGDD